MEVDVRLGVFRTALTARRFEERITELARAGELAEGLHLGAGQEVCQATALAALRDSDPMLYGHRGTAYWIARGMPLDVILCDIGYRERYRAVSEKVPPVRGFGLNGQAFAFQIGRAHV